MSTDVLILNTVKESLGYENVNVCKTKRRMHGYDVGLSFFTFETLRYGEMSRMRLVAATSWLKLARSQAYLECIEIEWYLSMSNVLCDPCPQVRSHFLTKLNQGLYKLRLPLEYMAIFALTASVQDLAFKQRAKKLLIANIQRRRDFLNKHPTYFRTAKILFALLPDYILPYVIYLLSHDSKWTKLNDSEMLNKIKRQLSISEGNLWT
ncbi:unnamed protein product [Heterobilharzia americana]|nr:unnamed protein product [Heterobilharzia americana]